MKVNIFTILKGTKKEDLREIKGPIIMLIIFFAIGVIFFPKPSKIYKGGVLKTCACLGLKATPRMTKGSLIGDEYCLGFPIQCQKQEILKEILEKNE
jgi:hypothetical protein